VPTRLFPDQSRTIIATNDSPDVGMEATVNPYRGCEHGCIYCYARPGHEYFGLSAGLDFESKIFVKYQAPQLLEKALQAKSWAPKTVFFSGVTDCYQPVERDLRLTRQCLEVLRDFRNPVALITKNQLVTRDIDILAEMAAWNGAYVSLSVTTLDGRLSRLMEPRASQPALRLKAVEALARAGIPVGIMIGPTIPGLTDHEIPAILKAAADAGARRAHYTMLRLPYGVKDHFQTWLQEHFPERAAKVLGHIREVRDGALYTSAFGSRMTGTGPYAEYIANMMKMFKKTYGLDTRHPPLSAAHFDRDARNPQGRLF
jgi:DNA repair photolyase